MAAAVAVEGTSLGWCQQHGPHPQQHIRLVWGSILGVALEPDQCYWWGGAGRRGDHLEVSCHLHGVVAGIICDHLASDLILSQRAVCVWTEG